MRILQVISSFPPAFAYGGPAIGAYNVSKELVKRGHEVTVYTTDVQDKNSRYKFEKNPIWLDGIEVYHFKNISNSLASNFHISCAPGMALELKKSAKKFDIIHCHEYRSFEATFAKHYSKKFKVPFILQPHGSITRLNKVMSKFIFDIIVGFSIIKYANTIIATSKFESKFYSSVLSTINEEKIIHIPNGIDLENYSNLPKKGSFKRKNMIEENDKIILFLSRIHEIKGGDLLLEAFNELKKEIKNVKLVIAGPDDGFLNELISLTARLGIENDVLFPGPLYGSNKLEAYVDADIFVLPSKYESFGSVVLEAILCDNPVVVTDVCGVTEWLGDSVYVIKPEKDQIKNALLEILSDSRLYEKLTAESKHLVTAQLGWDNVLSQFEKVYFTMSLKKHDVT